MFYFDTKVQETIQKEIARVMGQYNKEDAIQEAYVAITDESPLTVEDACSCASRAIHRFRDKISRISKHEQRDQDSWVQNSEPYFNYNESDEEGQSQYWWDNVASRTPVFNKGNQRAIKKILHDLGRTY
jgi:hypothetical protein